MTVTVSTPSAASTPVTSVSADVAKAYADAVAEAKAEIAKVEAALKGDEASAKSWLSSNWPHVVTWVGLAAPALYEVLKHV